MAAAIWFTFSQRDNWQGVFFRELTTLQVIVSVHCIGPSVGQKVGLAEKFSDVLKKEGSDNYVTNAVYLKLSGHPALGARMRDIEPRSRKDKLKFALSIISLP